MLATPLTMLASFALLASLTSAVPTATLLLNQSESTAEYTTVGISRHASTPPTIAIATFLNAPRMVEIYAGAPPAHVTWSYTSSRGGFLVYSARHAQESAGGADTIILQSSVISDTGNCTVSAFDSTRGNTSLWAHTVVNCFTASEDDTYRALDISDDGSRVALSGFVDSRFQKGLFFIWEGQTGALLYKETGTAGGAGPVQVSKDGRLIAYSPVYAKEARVLDGSTGASRGVIEDAYISRVTDSGDFVVFDRGGDAQAFSWNSTAYEPSHSWPLAGWRVSDVAVSSDAAAGELGSFLLESGTSEDVRLLVVSLASGATLLDATIANASHATLRMDAAYVAVACEGSLVSPGPTALLFRAGRSAPLLAVSTPGSMHAVEVVVDSVAAGVTRIVLAVAGKAVNDGVWGNGGEALAWVVEDDGA